jgi:hypothetical protein
MRKNKIFQYLCTRSECLFASQLALKVRLFCDNLINKQRNVTAKKNEVS